MFMEKTLERAGYIVLLVAEGDKAVLKYKGVSPSIIYMVWSDTNV